MSFYTGRSGTGCLHLKANKNFRSLQKAWVKSVSVVAASFVMAACSGQELRDAQNVAVTGVPHKIHGCKAVGPVYDDGLFDDLDDRTLEFRREAVWRGGNAVLLSSPATSSWGIAYHCDHAIRPDSLG